jgi:hypothetical protein
VSLLSLLQTPKRNDSEESVRSNEGTPKRRPGLKRMRSVSSVYVVVEEVSRRGYDKTGYLKKKRKKDGSWQQKWVGLRRPFLYCAEDSQGRGERAMDTSKCVVTVGAHDAEHPFSFAVVTRDRIWILSASTANEMHSWMKAIDPSLDVGPSGQRTGASAASAPQRTLAGSPAPSYAQKSAASPLRQHSTPRVGDTLGSSSADERQQLLDQFIPLEEFEENGNGHFEGTNGEGYLPPLEDVDSENHQAIIEELRRQLVEKTKELETANQKAKRGEEIEQQLIQAQSSIVDR